MKRLNDYFFINQQKKYIKPRMSLCGKLEAMIGNYFLRGAGIPDNDIQVLYYDGTVGFYDVMPLKKENIVAYVLENEKLVFVREDMLEKLKKDIEEYELIFVPVCSFDSHELYIESEMELPSFMRDITWIDDDFMNDENIEFDYDAFEIIDSGKKYVNPKHFSVASLVDSLQSNKQPK